MKKRGQGRVFKLHKCKEPSASFRFRDEGGVERHLAVAPTFSLVEMVRGRSTPVFFGGHFHVTRFGMFRSRAGLALNPWSTAASPQLAYRHRPFSTLKKRHPDSASFTEQGEEWVLYNRNVVKRKVLALSYFLRHPDESQGPAWSGKAGFRLSPE